MSAAAAPTTDHLPLGRCLLALDAELCITAVQPGTAAPPAVGTSIHTLLPGWVPVTGRQQLGQPAVEVDALQLPAGNWALAVHPRMPPLPLQDAVAAPVLGALLHELNNALTVILGQSELGIRGAAAPQERALTRIRSAAERMRELGAALVRLRGAAVPLAGTPSLVDDLAVVLGPYRAIVPPLHARQLDGLDPMEVGAIAAILRTEAPGTWRFSGNTYETNGLRCERADGGPVPGAPVLAALAAHLEARGGTLQPTAHGWSAKLRGTPPADPRPTVALVWIHDADLQQVLIEGLTGVELREIGRLDQLRATLTDHAEAVLITEQAIVCRTLGPVWAELRSAHPALRMLVLHGNAADVPPGAEAIPAPLDLCSLRQRFRLPAACQP